MRENRFSVIVVTLALIVFTFSACVENAKSSDDISTNINSATTDSVTQKNEADKSITVTIVTDKGQQSFTIDTDSENLLGALETADLIKGNQSKQGFVVTTVNGIKANTEKKEHWVFTKNGEALQTDLESTVISNGDEFEITLTTKK